MQFALLIPSLDSSPLHPNYQQQIQQKMQLLRSHRTTQQSIDKIKELLRVFQTS